MDGRTTTTVSFKHSTHLPYSVPGPDTDHLLLIPHIHTHTSYRHKEPEHRDEEFVWQIVRARLTAHTKFGLKCSGSLCL